MLTLRQRQITAIKQMLNLNQQQPKGLATEPVWKILIYDRVGQDIISPIISIKELRDLGVTLHVLLHSERDYIPDVPAIYFCAPTAENLDRIQQDFLKGAYDKYHLNFIGPIPRQKIEDLASSALSAGCVANIHKVFDQYVNFISLEDDFFVLKNQNSEDISYYSINRGNIRDDEMEQIMENIANSLFSVFVTLGNVPIIRCARNSAAEMVARKLEKKLRENLWDARNNLFQMDATQAGGVFSFQRPVLYLVDRNLDLATPLHHTWSYQALANDVLNLNLNRIFLEDDGSEAKTGTKKKIKPLDLDNSDKFWMSHKGSPFPTVAEAIQEELESYRSSEEEIKRLKSSMGIDGDNEVAMSLVNDTTTRLTNAVNSLPELLEKKRLIDMHTKIATSILNFIKSRRIDSFFELEEKIMSKQTLDRPLLDLLKDPEFGLPEDKMRLYIIYYICSQNVPEFEFDRMKEALQEAGCDLAPLSYINRWKVHSSGINHSQQLSNQYEGAGTKTVSMFSKLVSQGSSFVMEGVKNLVVKRHNLPITKLTDQVMECRSGSGYEADDFLYLDPKLLKGGEGMPKNRPPFQDAVVFVVGGGNYIEYQNLVDFIKQKHNANSTKRIIYGATTLNNSKQFLKELSELGREIQ